MVLIHSDNPRCIMYRHTQRAWHKVVGVITRCKIRCKWASNHVQETETVCELGLCLRQTSSRTPFLASNRLPVQSSSPTLSAQSSSPSSPHDAHFSSSCSGSSGGALLDISILGYAALRACSDKGGGGDRLRLLDSDDDDPCDIAELGDDAVPAGGYACTDTPVSIGFGIGVADPDATAVVVPEPTDFGSPADSLLASRERDREIGRGRGFSMSCPASILPSSSSSDARNNGSLSGSSDPRGVSLTRASGA